MEIFCYNKMYLFIPALACFSRSLPHSFCCHKFCLVAGVGWRRLAMGLSHVKVLWTILLWQCEILSVSISIRAHTLALPWLPSLMNLTTLVHYLHIANVIRVAKADEQEGERERETGRAR